MITETNLIIGFVLYTITLAGAAFAFGAIWSRKQDKTFCEDRRVSKQRADESKEIERWKVINNMRLETNNLIIKHSVLSERMASMEKLINIEARLKFLMDKVKGAE